MRVTTAFNKMLSIPSATVARSSSPRGCPGRAAAPPVPSAVPVWLAGHRRLRLLGPPVAAPGPGRQHAAAPGSDPAVGLPALWSGPDRGGALGAAPGSALARRRGRGRLAGPAHRQDHDHPTTADRGDRRRDRARVVAEQIDDDRPGALRIGSMRSATARDTSPDRGRRPRRPPTPRPRLGSARTTVHSGGPPRARSARQCMDPSTLLLWRTQASTRPAGGPGTANATRHDALPHMPARNAAADRLPALSHRLGTRPAGSRTVAGRCSATANSRAEQQDPAQQPSRLRPPQRRRSHRHHLLVLRKTTIQLPMAKARTDRIPESFCQPRHGFRWSRGVVAVQANPLGLRSACHRAGPARVRRRVASRPPPLRSSGAFPTSRRYRTPSAGPLPLRSPQRL